MCGISGILHFDSNRTVDRTILSKMTSALAHRGPDGEGYYVAGNIGLGHRRLAIIDLCTGAQPMVSADKTLVIVFNGEIYNYVELKDELRALGHTFATSSDTEVILKAYEQWGFGCQERLNGMWAFAIWDAREQHLFLSRDRIGEKPLHFSVRDNSLLFGSEIKSVLASGFAYATATDLLHLYLSLGYVPAPYTFYRGISKLMPGHYLVVKRGVVTDRVYWDLPSIADGDMRRDAGRIYEEFEDYFSQSVKMRMRSDVPFGAFLSGGLDSSSVVAAMSQASAIPVETFTIGFKEKMFDERQLAREVAAHFRTNHHEQLAEPVTFDESLRKIRRHFDEPFGDASALPVGLVSCLARQKVTMVLTGDGGDEVLSGYPSYVVERLVARYRKVPAFLRRGLYHSAAALSLVTKDTRRYQLNRLKRFVALSNTTFEQRFTSKLSLVDRKSIRTLIPAGVPQLSIEDYLSDVLSKCAFTDPFYRLMFLNLKVSLPDDMLAKVDRMSMAHSLEARVPFLDHRIIELTYCAHKDVKLPGKTPKNILKQAYGKRLPTSIVKAPKMPFSVPLREWFKQDKFNDRLNELQTSEFGLDGAIIGEIVKANKSGTHDYGDFIWRLFVLKEWATS